MKILKLIFPVVVAIILFSSCSSEEGKVISRRDMAEIYAEMLLTDQWITSRPELRKKVDTSLVYEPILNKYGYTTRDYIHTMDKYMDDPERYSRILRSTGVILDSKLQELQVKREELQRLEEIRKRLDKVRADYDYIVIDTTPMISVADASIVDRVADVTLFVIRMGVEELSFLPQLDKLNREKKLRNMALVLNDIDLRNSVNRTERFGQIIANFDVLITGHTHKPYVTYINKLVPQLRERTVKQEQAVNISGTSWLQYGGYAAQKMLTPAAHTLQKVILFGDSKHVEVRTSDLIGSRL